jgi:flagellar biosynthesis protein FlhG
VKLLLRHDGRRSGRKPLALINMVDSEREAHHTRNALEKTCRSFLKVAPDYVGFVPRDHHAQTAIRQQRALVAYYPDAPSSRAFREIARRLCEPAADGIMLGDALPLR